MTAPYLTLNPFSRKKLNQGIIEEWNIGMMECWNIGKQIVFPIIPLFQYSNIPVDEKPCQRGGNLIGK
jgi:hypothetical protein